MTNQVLRDLATGLACMMFLGSIVGVLALLLVLAIHYHLLGWILIGLVVMGLAWFVGCYIREAEEEEQRRLTYGPFHI
jgi:hypothetical protein